MTLDHFLHALRLSDLDYRLTPEPPEDVEERALATCPVCRIPWALELTVPVDELGFFCWTGCSEFQIRRALARDVHLSMAAELAA